LQAFSAKKAVRIEEQIGDESTKDQETKANKNTGCYHNRSHENTDFRAPIRNR